MIRAPAAERNKEPILNVLRALLNPDRALKALEIASGTGQHVAHFAKHFDNITWTPTDVDTSSFSSILKHVEHENLSNVNPPVYLDVSKPIEEWPENIKSSQYDLILCSNMIHITPWICTLGLFSAVTKLLNPTSGQLITYGPYAIDGVLTPESNVRFDEGLKRSNPEWGVRDIRDLEKLAAAGDLKLIKIFEMPANNKMLLFRKSTFLG